MRGEYLNVDDVIAFCLYLMNKMRWNLIFSLLCISNTIETIVSPNVDRLNLFVMFLCSLTGLKSFLLIFRAMTQSWVLIGGLEATKTFHWLTHVV